MTKPIRMTKVAKKFYSIKRKIGQTESIIKCTKEEVFTRRQMDLRLRLSTIHANTRRRPLDYRVLKQKHNLKSEAEKFKEMKQKSPI